ncbi:MAG: hypothetical protein ACRD21_27475, partial [Vicinamibacteria bacterium]
MNIVDLRVQRIRQRGNEDGDYRTIGTFGMVTTQIPGVRGHLIEVGPGRYPFSLELHDEDGPVLEDDYIGSARLPRELVF